jgi:hypothetical protein
MSQLRNLPAHSCAKVHAQNPQAKSKKFFLKNNFLWFISMCFLNVLGGVADFMTTKHGPLGFHSGIDWLIKPGVPSEVPLFQLPNFPSPMLHIGQNASSLSVGDEAAKVEDMDVRFIDVDVRFIDVDVRSIDVDVRSVGIVLDDGWPARFLVLRLLYPGVPVCGLSMLPIPGELLEDSVAMG